MTIEFYPVIYDPSFNLVSARHKMEENKNEDEAETDGHFKGKALPSQHSLYPEGFPGQEEAVLFPLSSMDSQHEKTTLTYKKCILKSPWLY